MMELLDTGGMAEIIRDLFDQGINEVVLVVVGSGINNSGNPGGQEDHPKDEILQDLSGIGQRNIG
jgi:hypothetical protein